MEFYRNDNERINKKIGVFGVPLTMWMIWVAQNSTSPFPTQALLTS